MLFQSICLFGFFHTSIIFPLVSISSISRLFLSLFGILVFTSFAFVLFCFISSLLYQLVFFCFHLFTLIWISFVSNTPLRNCANFINLFVREVFPCFRYISIYFDVFYLKILFTFALNSYVHFLRFCFIYSVAISSLWISIFCFHTFSFWFFSFYFSSFCQSVYSVYSLCANQHHIFKDYSTCIIQSVLFSHQSIRRRILPMNATKMPTTIHLISPSKSTEARLLAWDLTGSSLCRSAGTSSDLPPRWSNDGLGEKRSNWTKMKMMFNYKKRNKNMLIEGVI